MRLHQLLERKQQRIAHAFHGTTTEFLDQILSNGLDPNPPRKAYDLDYDASKSNRPDTDAASYASMGGIYLTNEYGTARNYARHAAKQFGGKPMIVIVQYTKNSEEVDEDDVYNWLADFWAMKAGPGEIDDKMDEYQAGDPHLAAEAEERYRQRFRVSKDTELDELLEILDIMSGYLSEGDINDLDSFTWLKVLYKKHPRQWKRVRELLASLLRKTGRPTRKNRPSNTFRLDRKVGFRGKTKIVAIVDGSPFRRWTAYGKVPDEYIKEDTLFERSSLKGAAYLHVPSGYITPAYPTHAEAMWDKGLQKAARKSRMDEEDFVMYLMDRVGDTRADAEHPEWPAEFLTGFVDASDEFHTRDEATVIAKQNPKQPPLNVRHGDKLDSTDLHWQNEAVTESSEFAGAAYKDTRTGKVYGPEGTHASVIWMMSDDDPKKEDEIWDLVGDEILVAGFLTTGGIFLDREQAARRVEHGGNLDTDDDEYQTNVDDRMWGKPMQEDYRWANQRELHDKFDDMRLGGAQGRLVSAATFEHEDEDYVVEFYDASDAGWIVGLEGRVYQVGFRPKSESGFEGELRTGGVQNVRRLIRSVGQIILNWVEKHKPDALLAGSPDDQKLRVFRMIVDREGNQVNRMGYQVVPLNSPVGDGIVFVKKSQMKEAAIREREKPKMDGAAYKDTKTGKIYGPGYTHYDVLSSDEMFADFDPNSTYYDDSFFDLMWDHIESGRLIEGFVDSTGKFYNREEAAKAIRLDPMKGDSAAGREPSRDWLDAFDLEYVDSTIHEERTMFENDDLHRQAMDDTGYWGSAGAGCLIMAADTKRLLLPLRSQWVQEPGTWGTWGGAIDPGEDPKKACIREVQEEAGYHGKILDMIHLYQFQDDNFRYDTFLAIVEHEFKATLNWETERAEWFKPGEWPSPLHFGLADVLKNTKAQNKLGNATST